MVYLLRAFVEKTGLKEVFIFNFHPFDWKKSVCSHYFDIMSLISDRQNVLLINVLVHFNWVTFILAVKFAVKQADNSQNCISKEQWAGSCSFLAPGLKKIGWTDCYKYDMSHHQVFNETLISKKLLSVL